MRKALRLALTLIPVLAAAACFNTSNVNLLPFVEEEMTAKVVDTIGDKRTDNRILMLDVDGIITGEGESFLFWEREATTTDVTRKLRRAAQDKRIKAVLVRVNSPGGTVTASDIVYREIEKFRKNTGVPVVTVMMDVAASGGYYIACASDKIVAHPTTITGSIGVIVYGLGFNGLFDKIGMESRVVKSGELKDMGNPFDAFSPEERAVFQNVVDKMYARFLSVARQKTKLSDDTLRRLADGRIYLGTEAKENGLIDEVGYLDDAIRVAMREAKINDAKVLLYTTSRKTELTPYSGAVTKGPELNMSLPSADTLMEMSRPRIMYVWLGQ